MKLPVTANLLPVDLADALRSRDLAGFLDLYGDATLLLIRLNSSDTELTLGLNATAGRGILGASIPPPVESMDFHTVVAAPRSRRWPEPTQLPVQVASRLVDGSHFAVSVRKRPGADAAFMDRISVGRARNKDIVLRHASVSKFHAWFEVEDTGDCFLSDAGSKNATLVNGTLLVPRMRKKVEPGDGIRFGAVEAFLCKPEILFEALSV